jgi:hypothetical protein
LPNKILSFFVMCPDTPLFFCPGGKYKGVENCVFDALI